MQKPITWKFAAVTLGLLAAPAPSAAQGNDELWEMTTRMEMPGMSVAMPARTYQVCMPKGSQQEQTMPKDPDSDCRTVESKKSGNKTTFKMVCSGKKQMTMTGETIRTGDSLETKSHMTFEGKRAREMTQTTTGKRVGSCDAAETRKEAVAQADAQKRQADTQKQQLEDMQKQGVQALADQCKNWAYSLKYDLLMAQQRMCGDHTRELCKRVDEVEGDPKVYFNFKNRYREDWEKSARACKKDLAAVDRQACKHLVARKNWADVREHCKQDATASAAANADICAGRDYTAKYRAKMEMGEQEYRELCRNYAKDELEAGAQREDRKEAGAQREESKSGGAVALDAIGAEGGRKLKKFLGF